MGLGTELKSLLKKRDVTVSELAKNTGIAPTTIYSMIQRDNKKIDIDVLILIARELGVSVDYFFNIEGDIAEEAELLVKTKNDAQAQKLLSYYYNLRNDRQSMLIDLAKNLSETEPQNEKKG